jgi:hypothetical protein
MNCIINIREIKLKGSSNTLSRQFGCITFHPSRYRGRAKLTPAVKNKWFRGWTNIWFYCRVPSQETEARGRGVYPLHSEMSALDYLVEAPNSCATNDVDTMAFEEATKIIRGRDAVEEFLAYGIWPLSDGWALEVEKMESLLLKVTVCMLAMGETGEGGIGGEDCFDG